jgi:hypothetical protein
MSWFSIFRSEPKPPFSSISMPVTSTLCGSRTALGHRARAALSSAVRVAAVMRAMAVARMGTAVALS